MLSAVIAALVWLNVSVKQEKTWDVCYPMANAGISWEQTFHSGGWSGVQ